MIQEAVTTDVQAKLLKHKAERGGNENLKQRAYLNSLTSMIDYSVLQIVGFIVSPFIVKGLGSAMYGIWKILTQMTGYATLADSRATQVLKWTVAKKKEVATEDELRSEVATAFVVSLFILPLVLIAGVIISWYAPVIANADPAYYTMVRITCALLVLSLTISKVFDLFESVLRGMNMGYKRMGFRAAIVLVGGGMKVYAITHGYGLIGLAVIQVFITLVTGLTFYYIVKKNVGWFGFGKTNFKRAVAFGKLSGWNMANTTADTILTSSDKVLLGFLAGPLLVSSYALTTFLPLAVQGLIVRVIIGVMPGIGKLLGREDYEKIRKVRDTLNHFIFLLMTASGVTVILFNQSFLNAWVGDGHFAGNLINGLIFLIVLQDIFIKHDGYMITATLDLKTKVYLTCIAAVILLVLAFVLVKAWGMLGLCLSLITGKFILFIGQRNFINKKIKEDNSSYARSFQLLITSLLMVGAAAYIAMHLKPIGLVHMLWLVPLTFIVSLVFYFFLGIGKEQKMEIKRVCASIRLLKSN